MTDSRKIKNAAARMWKKSQLNTTVKQCRKAEFEIEIEGDTTKIVNPDNGDIVLMSMFTGSVCIIRLDTTYFN